MRDVYKTNLGGSPIDDIAPPALILGGSETLIKHLRKWACALGQAFHVPQRCPSHSMVAPESQIAPVS